MRADGIHAQCRRGPAANVAAVEGHAGRIPANVEFEPSLRGDPIAAAAQTSEEPLRRVATQAIPAHTTKTANTPTMDAATAIA
jgi:hypothetical protein